MGRVYRVLSLLMRFQPLHQAVGVGVGFRVKECGGLQRRNKNMHAYRGRHGKIRIGIFGFSSILIQCRILTAGAQGIVLGNIQASTLRL